MDKKGLTIVAAAVVLLSGCARNTVRKPLTRSAVALDTAITLSIYDTMADTSVLDRCMEKIEQYEALFSRTIPDSDVSRINAAGGQWVTVSKDTRVLIELALNICRESGGAFDITVEPLASLWDFTGEDPHRPDKTALAEALRHVGYDKIEVQGNRVRLTDPQAGIDLGGVAKGYIADRLGDYLAEQQIQGALLNLGGNVLAMGDKWGEDFQIGIRAPDNASALADTMAVRDRSVVTSGSYERGFEEDGVWYHHILDPTTGYPVKNGLAAVTILSEESVTGDMLSTTCFVMGEEKGLSWIEQLDGVEALFIREDGTKIASSGFY